MRCVLLGAVTWAMTAVAQPVPADFNYWRDLGIRAYEDGRYSEAISAFQTAVDLRPNDATAHVYLGTAYQAEWIPDVQSRENGTCP